MMAEENMAREKVLSEDEETTKKNFGILDPLK